MLSPEHQHWLQAAAHFATALGVFFGVGGLLLAVRSYRNDRAREMLEREFGTFDGLDDKYVEFMYRCAEHPELDVLSTPRPGPRQLTEDQLRVERALFAVLISIFERAFLMFEKRASGEMRQRQYPGWKQTMRAYCLRESFLHEWQAIGVQFDSGFQEEMNALIAEEKRERDAVAPPAPQEAAAEAPAA